MIGPEVPKYRSGQRIKTAMDIINDESFPNAPPDGVLIGAGQIGEIIRVSMHTDESVPIYIVDFGERLIIGCFEDEIKAL
ncbi:nitrogen fixation protein NifZ [Bradyrhizobium pachyrhizi]|uniref:nitrogen fixation protein NifZ n=1 Tax=Bradyrhizobium pachyrhizi TaxID=280333 RepID=UPI0024B04D13|nr:nitrogen fixation protein NifZ [Bradyrhizobium pachyrhizi]WFU54703.1 nitrogen fixation protein NifZ [Bradyrhizobium pachyrhizi]